MTRGATVIFNGLRAATVLATVNPDGILPGSWPTDLGRYVLQAGPVVWVTS